MFNFTGENVMKKLLVFSAAVLATASAFAFTPSQPAGEVYAEARQRTDSRETLEAIALAGKSGGVQAGVLACALVSVGHVPEAVVRAMMRGGFDGSDIVNGAICKGASRDALARVAVDNGADPKSLQASAGSKSSGSKESTDHQDTNLGSSGGVFNGFGFSNSRAATFGGGGRGSVSKS